MNAVGIDFGTTNSSVALAPAAGEPRLARYALDAARVPAFRSVLYFERDESRPGAPLVAHAGPRAIEGYLSADAPGRLMQSLKSFLASRHFSQTNVLGTPFRLEGLIEILLRELLAAAEADLGPLPRRVVAGRPVRFVGGDDPADDELAVARLRAAFHNAGFEQVELEYEPVAAAYHYEQSLDRDELILIGDFGGGTSDFSLLRVGPGRRHGDRDGAVLGTEGVAIAGDAFDAMIVRHAVAPLLGRGSEYRSIFGRVLRVPSWIYAHVERWHHLSFLKSRETLQLLFDLRREALDPARIEALIHLVRAELGFHLYRTVERSKLELSGAPTSTLRFSDAPLEIDEPLERAGFEGWIEAELAQIDAGVARLLARTGVDESAVDRVFLTGGSSLVPAVRAVFARRFGEAKLRSGAELTSVASGLALRARELWTES
jgi:hypothetical chaperone protein